MLNYTYLKCSKRVYSRLQFSDFPRIIVLFYMEKLIGILNTLCIFSSFFLFSKKLPMMSVRLSSLEIISFHGISISNRPIDLKIGLEVRKGVVHVRKTWFFEILIASYKFMQLAIFCK